MTESINLLLDLPVETIAVLVAGYLGYRLAYIGKDNMHRTVDVVFRSLVFALIAQAVMALASYMGGGQWTGIAAGVAFSMAAAASWRKWGQTATFRGLRFAKVSMADGHQTALQSVVKRESIKITQLYVKRRNGTDLMCDDTAAFEDTATGPYWFGDDGSVALYVTHIRKEGTGGWIETDSLRGPWGDLITIIAADDIASIKIRSSK